MTNKTGKNIKLRVLISETFNPWFNIATEDWIFREFDPSFQTLYLWRNQETVVIGRSQNPWSECNLAKMEQDKVYLARRASGGGAVFHDLGNTCFTFLSPKQGYDRSANNQIILNALAQFGVRAEASGRNDIVIPMEDGPRKVSGAAFRETHDRAFHHGTLLIDANLNRLQDYLTPNPKKIQSKGRASVRARVMNLSEINSKITHETLSKAVIEEFFKFHDGECEVEVLDQFSLMKNESLQKRFSEFSDWNWRFGKTPEFNVQLSEYLSWGFVEVFIDSEKGVITRAQVFSDSLFPDLIENFQTSLANQHFSKRGIDAAVAKTKLSFPDQSEHLDELGTWLKTQVEIA